jgi:hypothetical protein
MGEGMGKDVTLKTKMKAKTKTKQSEQNWIQAK